MENLSRALVMAGGVIVAIMTISIFTFMFRGVEDFADSTAKNTKQQEIMDFNQAFTSYNKKLMYGSDVLSVINKAIDNNTRNEVTAGDDSGYSVDVAFKLVTSDLVYGEEIREMTSKTTSESISWKTKVTSNFLKGREYSIKNNQAQILSMLINVGNTEIPMTFIDDSGRTISIKNRGYSEYVNNIDRNNVNKYIEIHYPSSEFKRLPFKCVGVEYSNKTGRVKKMSFEEIRI